MLIGLVSDTHADKVGALPHVLKELGRRGVGRFIHCGDIEAKHVDVNLFLGLNVTCALNLEQLGKPAFQDPPQGWDFTAPDDRIRDLNGTRFYVGHKRSYRFLATTETEFGQHLEEFRRDHDGVRWFCSGHMHHQVFVQTRQLNFLNPGAIELSLSGGYEFATVDTESNEVVFSRILRTKPVIAPFSVGVISDSTRISEFDPTFWEKLAEELKKRKVKTVIHCGNIAMPDVGRKELCEFEIHFNLRPDQQNPRNFPGNWHLINPENPIVELNGYRFYVKLDLGATLLGQSEIEMHALCLNLRREYPETNFILCGFTNNSLLVEGEQVSIINPGDIVTDRNYAVIELPRSEFTFGHVPADPLPEL